MKKKNIKWLISCLLIFIIIILVLYQFGVFSGQKIEPGQTVNLQKNTSAEELYTVTEVKVPEYYTTIGSIHSRNDTEISSRLTAKITVLKVRSGDKVKEGDILVVLQNNELQAAVNQAKKNLEAIDSEVKVAKEGIKAADAELLVASEDYKRSLELSKSGNISTKQLQQAEARYKQADAAVRQAQLNLTKAIAGEEAGEAVLRQAKTMLSYSIIKSPINGVISEQLADVGDIAIPGKILFKVFDPKTLMLEIPVKESLANKIKVGDDISFYVKALNREFTSKVKEVVPFVDSETRTFLVKVCIGEAKGMVPGMYGKAKIQIGTKEELLIPNSSVKQIGQTELVQLVENKTVKRIYVRTVESSKQGFRNVISGLKAGDKIIKDYTK